MSTVRARNRCLILSSHAASKNSSNKHVCCSCSRYLSYLYLRASAYTHIYFESRQSSIRVWLRRWLSSASFNVASRRPRYLIYCCRVELLYEKSSLSFNVDISSCCCHPVCVCVACDTSKITTKQPSRTYSLIPPISSKPLLSLFYVFFFVL